MDDASILGLTWLGCAILFVLLAIPLVQRRVKPNGLYGYRTVATLNDEAHWYQANARFGKGLLLTGVTLLAIVAAHHFGYLTPGAMFVAGVGDILLGIAGSVVYTQAGSGPKKG